MDLDRLDKLEAILLGADAAYRQAHKKLRAAADRMGYLRGEISRVTAQSLPPGQDPRPAMEAELVKLVEELPNLQRAERHHAEVLMHHQEVTDRCRAYAGRPRTLGEGWADAPAGGLLPAIGRK